MKVADEGDRVPENNTAVAALLVEGTRSILLVNDDGADDALARALRKAGLPVDVASAENARLDAISSRATAPWSSRTWRSRAYATAAARSPIS